MVALFGAGVDIVDKLLQDKLLHMYLAVTEGYAPYVDNNVLINGFLLPLSCFNMVATSSGG